MPVRTTLAALILLSGLVAVPAWGQQNSYQRQQSSPSFSDRLRALRDGVLGPSQGNHGQAQGQGNNPNMRSNPGANGNNGNGANGGNNGQSQQQRRPNGQPQNYQPQNNQRQGGQRQDGQPQPSRMNGGQAGSNMGRPPAPNETRNFHQGNSNAQHAPNAAPQNRNGGNGQSMTSRPAPPRQPTASHGGNQVARPQKPGSSRRTAQSTYKTGAENPANGGSETNESNESADMTAVDEIVPPTAEESDTEPNRLVPADLLDPAANASESDDAAAEQQQITADANRKKSSRRKVNQPSESLPVADEVSEEPADLPEESVSVKEADPLPRVTSSARPTKPEEEILPRASASRSGSNSRVGNEFIVTKRGPSIRVETAGPKRIMVNKPGTYKVHLHNAGDVPAEDVLVVVQVPTWAEVLSAEATVGESRDPDQNRESGEFQWAVANLAAHSHEELVLQIVAHENRSFDLAVQWNSSPITAQAKVEVQEAKLEATLAGPGEVSFGAKAVYKLTFSNPGSADAENVIVKLLPLGNGDEPVETHSLGKISAGASKTVEVELVARQEGQVKVQVQAVADGGLTASATESVIVRRPAIKVAIDAPKFRYSGTVATYSIKVANTGNDSASDVQVAVQLPRGAQFASCSADGKRISNGTGVSWRAESIKSGEEREFQVKCSLTTPGANRVQATATALGDLSHNASGSTQVEALADLTLDVNDPQGAIAVGEDVMYEIVVRNRGTKAAEDVEVTASFSQDVEPLSVTGDKHDIRGSKVEFEPIASVGPGQEITLKIRAQARRPGTHVMRTEVRSQDMPTALVEEETTRFYGNDDDKSDETSRLEQPARSSDSKSVKFQPRKANSRSEKPRRTADPASHEDTDWKSSRDEGYSTNEPQRLDEPAELQPIE